MLRPELASDDVIDRPELWPVNDRTLLADARVFRFLTDTVTAPDGAELKRSYIQHPGAVVIIALDDDDHVVVLQQYRHPVGMRLLEPPAGLLDISGEDYVTAAKRELAEEALLAADDWRVLADFFGSPGSTQESARIYLARGLHDVAMPADYQPHGEEADLMVNKVALDDLRSAILAGRVHNGNLIIGTLALLAARSGEGLDALRPADAPWSVRAQKEALDHVID